jgi:sugar/nucleoside kinase (ribokinase family)|tara:strand:- start:5780 stop:6904 length:1125 start_codon:yes stop_codon:yes gene_type:complete
MDNLTRTLKELAPKASTVGDKTALVGLDGFIDRIMEVVGKRHGPGEQFDPLPTIDQWGARVSAAAGESANFELWLKYEKLGGNGPNMANALLAASVQTRYLGMLGKPVHPLFADFAKRCDAISLGDPGVTHAIEFGDGKIMLGEMADYGSLTYERIIDSVGEGAFHDILARSDLISLINWTMTPHLTSIFNDLLSKVLPNLPPKDGGRIFFFDLCDPAKRSDSDLRSALEAIKRFQAHGRAVLGVNLAEALQVGAVLGKELDGSSTAGIKAAAGWIRDQLEIANVVIHRRDAAACATKEDTYFVNGPFIEKPLISTGAGDHFNAGFCLGLLLDLSPEACLTVAVATSGQYVRTAESPSISKTESFLERWQKGDI